MIKLPLSKELLFTIGEKPSLGLVLLHREKRLAHLAVLREQYSESAIIIFKCNIPGSIKANDGIKVLFEEGIQAVHDACALNSWEIIHQENWLKKSGYDSFMVLDTNDALAVKAMMVEIEEQHSLGRLWDIDVFNQANESISRKEVNGKERACLVCENDAKTCGSRRLHSLDEIQAVILEILERGAVIFDESKEN